LVPFTVKVNAAPPAVTLVGEIEASVGTGLGALEMLKTKFVEVPPPGVGLVTVTFALPEVVISEARIAAVSCVELTKVVVFALPLNFTAEVETKPVPLTVRVNAAPPAVAPVGESEVIFGDGLLTVKFDAVDGPPPGAGLLTTTGGVPAVAMSVACTAMVTCVALTNVTARAVLLNVPVIPLTKFVPLTVRVKAAPPAVAFAGENEVMVGTGLLTLKLVALDVPPPGAGFVTVTGNDPPVAMSAAVMEAVN